MPSRRTGWDRSENALSLAIRELAAKGAALVDLTESNPLRAGLVDARAAVRALGHERGASYAPDARGLASAREAIVAYHASHGARLDPSQIVVTASSSEAYSWLFALLADPGDRVLVPRPSYPLFGYLASLAGVTLTPYDLLRDEAFRIDLGALERAIDERTRAILVVHPNNPTGSRVRDDDARALVALAASRRLALIVDEVFVDYPLERAADARRATFAGESGALVFVLSGLSKVALLPQLKLGWIAVSGPPSERDEALARLELIGDTFLSTSTPVQLALAEILRDRGPAVDATRARVRANLDALDRALALADGLVTRHPIDAGWYAMLEVPRVIPDDEWAFAFAAEARAIVYPGHFFEVEREGTMVVSLLPEPGAFADAIARVVEVVVRRST